jgi:ribosomal protein S18 acetylase RimI-like enzyme
MPPLVRLTRDPGLVSALAALWIPPGAAEAWEEHPWHLDSIAVPAELRGRGIGRAVIEAGLERARADRTGAFLSTGTRANVAVYGRCGFRVYAEASAPDGGPRVWFTHCDP